MSLVLGEHRWETGERVVMAIINRTPDSFYAAARGIADDAARETFERAVAGGAGIVDIGGIRAGHGAEVSAAEEIDRVGPFLQWAAAQRAGVALSVDTWRAEVVRALAPLGVDLVNDTWAGADPEIAVTAARFRLGLVCSHTGGQRVRTDPHRVSYGADPGDVTRMVRADLERAASAAMAAGIARESVLIDPTHDFGKNTRQGIRLLRDAEQLAALGHPVLMALSRKDFIGEAIGASDPAERLPATLAATLHAAERGAMVFRTHDPAETRQALDMLAVLRGEAEPRRSVRGIA